MEAEKMDWLEHEIKDLKTSFRHQLQLQEQVWVSHTFETHLTYIHVGSYDFKCAFLSDIHQFKN